MNGVDFSVDLSKVHTRSKCIAYIMSFICDFNLNYKSTGHNYIDARESDCAEIDNFLV